ncbi:MAG: CPBP family intramembrane glutamic endopeptidase [Haloarculaceae archaeon]
MSGRSVRAVFWNDDEGRPRAFWRLCVALVLLLAASVATLLGTSALAALAPDTAPATPTALFTTTAALAPYVASSGALVVATHSVDRRRLRDLGLANSREWWADCAFGLALGLVLPGLVLAVEVATGAARVTGSVVTRTDPFLSVGSGVAFPLALACTLVFFVGVGTFEELLFRGYLLVNLAEGLDGLLGTSRRAALAGAVALTSLGFGVVHAANPSATALALGNITLFGGFFAASHLLTGRVGVAVGFHVAWNFAVSAVFGFPVSGITSPVTVLAVEVTGAPLLTGGEFGPEGGLFALVALLAGWGALAGWVRWREGELRVRDSVAVPDLR